MLSSEARALLREADRSEEASRRIRSPVLCPTPTWAPASFDSFHRATHPIPPLWILVLSRFRRHLKLKMLLLQVRTNGEYTTLTILHSSDPVPVLLRFVKVHTMIPMGLILQSRSHRLSLRGSDLFSDSKWSTRQSGKSYRGPSMLLTAWFARLQLNKISNNNLRT